MQSASRARLLEIVRDDVLREKIRGWLNKRKEYLEDKGWFGKTYPVTDLKKIAYFSMEFGLGEALPIYSGGLGILAGDFLKTASDLGVPVVGIGLLYQQGYFRQVLSSDGWQLEAFPYNDPTTLPIVPVQNKEGGLLRVKVELPGRTLLLRIWEVLVGKVKLYLLDSNDPFNSPWDRGLTSNLYPSGKEQRLIQEIALGLGGWSALEQLGEEVDVLHLNEGHAAFAGIARAHQYMRETGQSFSVALRAVRAGNVFTTHTPVKAAFDQFDPTLVAPYLKRISEMMDISDKQILALGRKKPEDTSEPFNMAYLAMNESRYINGVSQLHGKVSRQLFQPLFPRWPEEEVPVQHVTNGVHMPSWDSQAADELWTAKCGKDRWLVATGDLCKVMDETSFIEIWNMRTAGRKSLVHYIRNRLVRQFKGGGKPPELIERAKKVLDPNALTLGFARRFTSYKRPTLLLHDSERMAKILLNSKYPVQLIVAGKSHPNDQEGKKMVQSMARFAHRLDLFNHVVFLEDYDITLAQQLAAGIDIWMNTPRRPNEASGTSGMKVLVNGGLNLSELDGWWAEAYTPEVGWGLGDGREHNEPVWDAIEAEQMYTLLEEQIIREFYTRDPQGIPSRWVERIRKSMSSLTPHFSANRMVREYTEKYYLPASKAVQKRTAQQGKVALEIENWCKTLSENWEELRFGEVKVDQEHDEWHFHAQVYCGEIDPSFIQVEGYAEPKNPDHPHRFVMTRKGTISGAVNGHLYFGKIPITRPADDYTLRVVPFHPEAGVPMEANTILWQR
jgi:starch phosphorylase